MDLTTSVQNAAAGDTERWLIQPVEGRVLVKPKAPGIETNLIILTARHAYHLTLKSGDKYMPRVAFYYPREIIAAEANRKAEFERRASTILDPGTAGQTRLRLYRIGPRRSVETRTDV